MAEQKKKHSHDGHRQRVKDKALEGGIEHWPIHEVMELLLMYAIPQKDVNPLAHELINTFGSFGAVLDAGYEQLKKIKGIGNGTALFLSLLPDFFLKYTASKNTGPVLMDEAYKTINYFRTIDRVRDRECIYIFCLNGQKKMVKTIKFNNGLSTFIDIPIPELAQQIVYKSHKSIVILHTHPNGTAQPSPKDIEATKKLINSFHVLGIKVEDHIIVTENSYYSFLNSKILEDLKRQANPTAYEKEEL